MVVKLDMAKAYDRVSWIYLTKVMRRIGFEQRMIDITWRLISNNWYSILLNEQLYGFFPSSRGVKQGDPLSPNLFIIVAEMGSRSINKLTEDESFIGFGLLKWSDKINHLSYADDTILFCSANKYSVRRMMQVLRDYEKVSGQMINLNKSFLYLHEKTPTVVGQRLRRWTGIEQGYFPFTYLGCPIFYGRKKKEYFEGLVKKVHARIMFGKTSC